MAQVDRNSPVPMYHQLKLILLEQIDGGVWKPGDMIPSEQELQDAYGLSRTTVRQTLGELVFEGKLVRQRGRGTFVARPKLAHEPFAHERLTDNMRQQGMAPGWRLLDQGWCTPPQRVQAALGLAEDTEAYCVRRIRLADQAAIGYHVAYLPTAVAKHIDQDALRDGESLGYLHDLPELASSRASRTIEALPADEPEVECLGMEPGAPVLRIERLVESADGSPLEFLWASYRGDAFKYRITM